MEKFNGIRYNSRWDSSTWLIIAITMVCCVIPCFLDDGISPIIICPMMLVFIIVTFRSVYYKIDGDRLVVYQFFIPTAYPIDKIKEIRKTKSILSAPATSLTNRLAVTFTERKVLKSSMPLIISPVRREEFISHILSINPDIMVNLDNRTSSD